MVQRFTQTAIAVWEQICSFFLGLFEVSSTKRSRIVGVSFTGGLLLVTLIDIRAFSRQTFSEKWLLFACAIAGCFIIGATIAFRIGIKNDLINKIWHFLLLLLAPFPTITMAECLNGVFVYDMTYIGFMGNYVLILLLYFFFFAVTGSIRVPFLAVNPLIFGLAVANYYILDFRGTPFLPMDFLSVGTALGVAGTYAYRLTYPVLLSLLILIWTVALGIRLRTPDFHIATKITARVFSGAFFGVIMLLFYCTSIFAEMGVKPDFWNQVRGYRNYGFSLMFFCNTKYLYMSEPSGYDPNAVGEYVHSVVNEEENPPVIDEDAPNIICIMNESLSDLSVLGNFTTNADYMPFMHALTENTIKGNLYVPVIGAGTSNTEFEFLTGHTTAFLPVGSNAYMLYVKQPIASLVSTLEDQGFSSYAFHPYIATGWNRVSVYENLGFNLFDSLETLLIPEVMQEYTRLATTPDDLNALVEQYYPGEKMLLRQYVSDSYNYRSIIKNFEARDRNIPYFCFNVTMQNHGGYTLESSNFEQEIYLTGIENATDPLAATEEEAKADETGALVYYEKANRYLSLVKRSDDAFRELIEYFSGVSEPTVICMFGDHQPSIENSFISKLLGVDDLSNLAIEQEQARHVTPFFIWANYDIPEATYEKLSANYLSSLVLQTAGVRLTQYNQYLLKMMQQLPVIDSVGYIDANNNYYRWSDSSEYSEKLKEYERIQYNNIFETVQKDNTVFFLNREDQGGEIQ